MFEDIHLTIPGNPVAKRTHRTYVKVDWKNERIIRWNRFPQREKAQGVSWDMRSQYNGPLIDESVYIIFKFYMTIPQRWTKKVLARLKEGLVHHITKPDVTNLAKFYEDCLKGVVLTDDKKVVWATPVKLYDENPRTEIIIKPFDYEAYRRYTETFERDARSDPRPAS